MAGLVGVKGLRGISRYLQQLQRGVARVNTGRVLIGSKLPYAYEQEFGTSPRGRRSLRGGGRHYLERALAGAQPEMRQALVDSLAQGLAFTDEGQGTADAFRGLVKAGLVVAKRARRMAPRGSRASLSRRGRVQHPGALRRSINVYVERTGGGG